MPNWCDNRITIHGPKKYIRKIDKIVNENTNGDGLLNYMMPMPTELKDTTSPSSAAEKKQPVVDGFDNWYDWRVSNWGTKWELCCLLYTSPSPRDLSTSRMPSSA